MCSGGAGETLERKLSLACLVFRVVAEVCDEHKMFLQPFERLGFVSCAHEKNILGRKRGLLSVENVRGGRGAG